MLAKAYRMWLPLVKKMGYIKGTYLFFLRAFFRNLYSKAIIKILKKEMKDVIGKYKKLPYVNKKNEVEEYERAVWIFWYQGYDNMPDIVKGCYKSIVDNLGNDKKDNIHLITKYNIKDYVDIDINIINKINNKNITITHFSDILRAELLKKYGGCWIDATCFVVDKPDDDIWEYEFYSQKYAEGKANFFNDGKWSAYFLMCKKESIVFSYLNDFFEEYWRNNDYLIEYYLIDYALYIAYNEIDVIKKIIDKVPENNPEVMTICEKWNDNINDIKLNNIVKNNWFLKLTWKEKIDFDAEKQTVAAGFYKIYIDKYLNNV